MNQDTNTAEVKANATRAAVIESALAFNHKSLRLILRKLFTVQRIRAELASYKTSSQLNEDMLSILLAAKDWHVLEDHDEDDDSDDDESAEHISTGSRPLETYLPSED